MNTQAKQRHTAISRIITAILATFICFDSYAGSLSAESDTKMGQSYFEEIQSAYNLSPDPIVNDYVINVGLRLVHASQSQNQAFHFFVVESSDINAFTGPGGYIGINTGLLNIIHSQGELSAVMAHEVAHVVQHHISRSIDRERKMRIPAMVLSAAAIAVAAKSSDPDIGTGALSATMAGFAQNALRFSRANESEADRIGVGIMVRAGFNPNNMPVMFQRLQETQKLYPNDIPAYLQTHPMDDIRIADSFDLAAQYPKKNYYNDPYFDLIAVRVRLDTERSPRTAKEYYQQKLSDQPNNLAYRYGYGLSLLQLRQNDLAQQQIDLLLKKAPDNSIFLLAKADCQIDNNQKDLALATLKKAYTQNPHYYPADLAYAAILVENRSPDAAKFIQEQTRIYPSDASMFYLLAHAEANAGNNAESHAALAEYFHLKNNDKQAYAHLQIALPLSEKNSMEQSLINQKVTEIKADLKDE